MSSFGWTEVRFNSVLFTSGKKNSSRKGDCTYSLHQEGANGWIVKQYRGKVFVSSVTKYAYAKDRYNRLVSGAEG